jgi:hypothetical protein
MEKNPDPGFGMNIPDLIFENLLSVFWVTKIRIRDLVNPGSRIRDGKSRIRDKQPGSATLYLFTAKGEASSPPKKFNPAKHEISSLKFFWGSFLPSRIWFQYPNL